jgi:hypothetical protein
MSLATFAVEPLANRIGDVVWHRTANSRASARYRRSCRGVTGYTGADSGLADSSSAVRKQVAGSERPTPRGSKPTMSYRARTCSGYTASAPCWTKSTPEPLIEAAQARWRAVNAPHLVALVRAGARFEHGKLVEREPNPVTQEAA